MLITKLLHKMGTRGVKCIHAKREKMLYSATIFDITIAVPHIP